MSISYCFHGQNYPGGRARLAIVLAALALSGWPAYAEDRPMDIMETLRKDANLSTFVHALELAEITHILKEDGPFTVFAPSDQAFRALPDGLLKMFLKPDNRDQLQSLLSYHVCSDLIGSAGLKRVEYVMTANGDNLFVSQASDVIAINNARIIRSDITCTNGIIHVIDAVIFSM